jgi:Mg/Co/Ni transporter MgtE
VKHSEIARPPVIDEKTAALGRDAANALSAVDTRTIASVAETLRRFETAKLVDMSAMREAAKAFESMRPIVAPQIAPQIAEALRRAYRVDCGGVQAD